MSFVFPESCRKSQERITYNLLYFSKYLPCQFYLCKRLTRYLVSLFFINFNTFAITTLVNMFKTLIVLEQLVIHQLDIQYVFKFHYNVLPTTFLFILQCFCNKNFSKHVQNFDCHKMVCKSFAVVYCKIVFQYIFIFSKENSLGEILVQVFMPASLDLYRIGM